MHGFRAAGLAHEVTAQVDKDLIAPRSPGSIGAGIAAPWPHGHGDLQHAFARGVEAIEIEIDFNLSWPPTDAERKACAKYLAAADSPEKGLQGVLWSLINTREFLLQH